VGTAILVWNDYRYLPYERDLAMREAARISTSAPKPIAGGILIQLDRPPDVCRRLTYFREVLLSDTGTRIESDQARLEASSKAAKNGTLTLFATESRSSRQSTRYSAHGLHEYKGKFNPQICLSRCLSD
jgi:site-specific DNA-methyltransferase (cytosine-N4-specific)